MIASLLHPQYHMVCEIECCGTGGGGGRVKIAIIAFVSLLLLLGSMALMACDVIMPDWHDVGGRIAAALFDPIHQKGVIVPAARGTIGAWAAAAAGTGRHACRFFPVAARAHGRWINPERDWVMLLCWVQADRADDVYLVTHPGARVAHGTSRVFPAVAHQRW